MSKTKELIDLIQFRASGIGQAPDYDYKVFFIELQGILRDPKWNEEYDLDSEINEGDCVKVIANDCLSVNEIGDIGEVVGSIGKSSVKVFVPGKENSQNWHPRKELHILSSKPKSNEK